MPAPDVDGLDKLWNALPILIVNGATLLVVVVILIRVLAKVIERGAQGFAQSVAGLKDEVGGMRQDIRETGREQAIATGALTERVSRIEGKIEGIAISAHTNQTQAAMLADTDDQVTPVQVPIPTPPFPRAQTNVEQVGRNTPAAGVPRFPGTYGPRTPKKPQVG